VHNNNPNATDRFRSSPKGVAATERGEVDDHPASRCRPNVSRRTFLKRAGLAALGTASWLTSGCGTSMQPKTALSGKKPNFVFFLIDDLGRQDLGCFGSTFYETPNLDRLAREGVRFTDAYAACCVCSPTRASIMTGKYPARLRLTNFIAGRRTGKLTPADFRLYMPLEEVTVAEALKDAGYTTGFFGKWHMGGSPYLPEAQGFDVNVAGDHHGAPPSYFSPYGNDKNRLNLPPGPEGEYITDRLTDEAVRFINTSRDKPFLAYVSHYAVHVPLQAKEDLTARYTAKSRKLAYEDAARFAPEHDRLARQVQDHAVYAAMIHSMDESVGRIMETLRQLDLERDTVVMFMSDNGGLSTAEGSPTSNVPLRAGKGWLYEGGIREPLIIKWPGVAKRGSKCSTPVTSTDFYPTMLEMAGQPPRPDQHCDGVSLVPLLRGAKSLRRQAIYWHYPHYSNQGGRPSGAVRAGDFKLIENYEDASVELYNLREDIGEKTNLAHKLPDVTKRLQEMLHRWLKETDAVMPTPNPDSNPAASK